MDKLHKSLAKVMRGVASTEPNQKLQNTFFMYAQKHEMLERERADFLSCDKKATEIMDESKKLLVAPLRVLFVQRMYTQAHKVQHAVIPRKS